jgi:DNA-binding MarR family transcriptional regulator
MIQILHLVEANLITEPEQTLELTVQTCLLGVGITLLSEWDVLAFVYRHGASLTSADQIARLIGYEKTVVGGALDRLERQKLIERSRPSHGVHEVRFYRISPSADAEHRRCIQELFGLSASRAGRLLLEKRLKPVRQEAGGSEGR